MHFKIMVKSPLAIFLGFIISLFELLTFTMVVEVYCLKYQVINNLLVRLHTLASRVRNNCFINLLFNSHITFSTLRRWLLPT